MSVDFDAKVNQIRSRDEKPRTWSTRIRCKSAIAPDCVVKSSPPIYETASFVINVNQMSSQADQQTGSRTRQDENGSVFIEREVRRQLASEPTPPEQVHLIPPTAGFLDRSALYGVLAHGEMLGLDPGRGPAGHTKTAGHPTPA
jgi:hypothetical protein